MMTIKIGLEIFIIYITLLKVAEIACYVYHGLVYIK